MSEFAEVKEEWIEPFHTFHASKASHPVSHPAGFLLTKDEVVYDPSVHLAIEHPVHIKTLPTSDTCLGKLVRFPIPISDAPDHKTPQQVIELESGKSIPFTGLAYSAPFRLLSDEGVLALRAIAKKNEQYACGLESRAPKSLRGLSHRSQFIRDFNYCPVLLDHFSKITGTPLCPHQMSFNHSQMNFGEIGNPKAVDEWHIDSVPYVVVILLSDTTDMVGGELKVALLGDPSESIDKIHSGTLSAKYIDTVQYPGPGYCIFMQGSRIAHTVTPVVAGRETRLTCVNSYQSLNPFSSDRTIYSSFTMIDEGAAAYDYARHVSWRVQGKLDYLLNHKDLYQKDEELLALLDNAAAEMARVRDLVAGKIVDKKPYKSHPK